jgi:hypothetical protein
MNGTHDTILERLQEQRQESYKTNVKRAVSLLRIAAEQAPSYQEKCDLVSAILDLEEAVNKTNNG